ncbi:energy coupling factor transporter S component ThiW [Intestinibacter sp.]
MKTTNLKKLTLTAMLITVAVVGSLFSFPVFASKCSPVQHMVNILCAVLLGPSYGLAAAFAAALIRNLLGLGTLLAFPGSMCGALICAIVYKYTKKIILTCVGEVFGTAILGGLCAYPIAIAFMGKTAGDIAFYAYILPFFVSTAVGAVLSAMLILSLNASGVLKNVQVGLEG